MCLQPPASQSIEDACYLAGRKTSGDEGLRWQHPDLINDGAHSGGVRDLGLVLDSQLTMCAYVNSVCRSAYYQLRQLRPVVCSLSADAASTVVQAFVSSHLDYCNSVMYGAADGLIQRLKAVQNAPHDWWLECGGASTSVQFSGSSIGAQFASVLPLSWPFSYSRRCTA